MSKLLWNDVSQDWQARDSVFRDIYVLDVTEADWQRVVDAVRTRWPSTYQADGQSSPMPPEVGKVFQAASRQSLLWQVKLREGVFANCHFLGREEIEFDLDSREISNQLDLDSVCELVRVIGQVAAKTTVLCMENSPDLPIARYDPSTDQFTRVA